MFRMVSKKSFSKADGTYEVLLNGQDQSATSTDSVIPISENQGGGCVKHSITVNSGDSDAGTITFLATPIGGAYAEPLYESDGTTPVVMDLSASPRTVTAEIGALKSFSFTTASLDGEDNVIVTISSGD